MLCLILAILCSSGVSIAMRLSEGKTTGTFGKLIVNYILCTVLSLVYLLAGGGLRGTGTALTLGLGALNGFLYLACLVVMHLSMASNGVILSATFMKLGLLVPMAVSLCLFGERPGPFQAVGFALALCAILVINYQKGERPTRAGWLLVLLLLTDGGGSAMAKVFEELGSPEQSDLFLLLTFGTALVLCAAVALRRGERLERHAVCYGLLIGLPNYFSTKFLLGALRELPAVVVYPTFNVASIVLVTAVGVLFFRERLDCRRCAGLGLILVSLVLLNLAL